MDTAVRDLPEELPRDRRTEARLALHKELNQAVRQAREAHAHSLYLPVRPVRGHLLAASFVVSERLAAPGAGTRDDLAAGLLRAPRAWRWSRAMSTTSSRYRGPGGTGRCAGGPLRRRDDHLPLEYA
ncbi:MULTISPECIES: hypothetical protein [Streptomyces]|uniref:hypothetical protein n=1 Tax=Streptomyces TaxID=1883 RepID=UPI00068D9F64|nr:hypothetical protein [Streptomyces sp. M10]QDD60207.1 hypothetical protein FE156_18215 [Streptomyces albidoflavus]WTC03576.1 hypothetical protein OG794_17960 [Streptomyces albidoflavus]